MFKYVVVRVILVVEIFLEQFETKIVTDHPYLINAFDVLCKVGILFSKYINIYTQHLISICLNVLSVPLCSQNGVDLFRTQYVEIVCYNNWGLCLVLLLVFGVSFAHAKPEPRTHL